MDENKKGQKYIIVIINNIKGNISHLNLILNKISKQNKIDFLILTGEVFTLLTKEEDILSISFKGPIIIFDSSPLGEIIKSKNGYNNYILKNNIFLGRSGIFTPFGTSINIAFLSGIESKEFLEKNNSNSNLSYTNKFYKYKDVENIINNHKNNNKIDFFLINTFPQSLYERYYETIKEDCSKKDTILNEEKINNSKSYSLNYLLYIMNPRYVISSVDDFFYKNINDVALNSAGYRTFFYNLGYLEDKINKSENFFMAINYQSINDMGEIELLNLEKEQEEKLDEKFIKDKNLFKYFITFELNEKKTLLENYDEYLRICFYENGIKSIKDMLPIVKPLLISNLNYNTSEEEIKNYLINKYGSIKSIKFLRNKENKFNGKAIVHFNNTNSMNEMLNNNGKDKLNDRVIKVMVYIPRDQLNNFNNNNSSINNKNIIDISNMRNNNIAECWFCYENNEKLDTKYIINNFNYFYLAYPKGPIDKYHFLVVPKKHISSYVNLTKDEKIECEMIIQLVKDYLYSKDCDFIIFEKNLKYNFANTLHMLINICSIENSLIEKLNNFSENFLIDEKINDFLVSFNEKFLDLYNHNDEYIYINIPKIYKQKIIRKIIFIKTKEYKIDYPRKMICDLIKKEDRVNWKNTINLGEEYLNEIKNEVKKFLNDNFIYK